MSDLRAPTGASLGKAVPKVVAHCPARLPSTNLQTMATHDEYVQSHVWHSSEDAYIQLTTSDLIARWNVLKLTSLY